MAYNLVLPNGQIVSGINDKYSQDEAYAILRKKMPQAFADEVQESAPDKPKRGGYMGSLAQGFENLVGSSATGAEAVVGDKKKAVLAGEQREKETAARYVDEVGLAKIEAAYEKDGLTAAIGEFTRQVPHFIAQNAPQLVASFIAAKYGAAVGALTPIPGGAAAGAVIGGVGALIPSYIGTNVQREGLAQRERGEEINPSVGTATVAAAAQAGLDFVSLKMMGGKVVSRWMGLPEKTAAAELRKAAERSLLKSAGVGAARGTTEVPTEVAQAVIERANAGLDLLSDDALAEYGENALGAVAVGPSLGSLGGIADRSSARAQIKAKDREEAEAKDKATREAEAVRLASPEYLNSLEGIQAQKKEALAERFKAKGALDAAKKALKAGEITPDALAEAQAAHDAAAEKVQGFLTREIEVKKTPEQKFIEGVDQSYQSAEWGPKNDRQSGPAVFSPAARAAQRNQPQGEFLPGVPMSDAPKDALVDDTGPSKLGFTPDYKTATPEEALLLSLTNPEQYKGWTEQTRGDQMQAWQEQYGNVPQPTPAIDTAAPAMYEQQGQILDDAQAGEIADLREQGQQRRVAEQEEDLTQRTIAKLQNQQRRVGMADRSPLVAAMLGLDKGKLVRGEYTDDDVLRAVEQRIEALKREQYALTAQQMATTEQDAQGNVNWMQPTQAMAKAARNDRLMERLQTLQQTYQENVAKTRDVDQVTALINAAGKPDKVSVEPRPVARGPVIEPSPLKTGQRPIVTQSPDTTIPRDQAIDPKTGQPVEAQRDALVGDYELSKDAEKRERLLRAEKLKKEREDATALFVETLINIHEGNVFTSNRDVLTHQNLDSARGTFDDARKTAAAQADEIVRLAVAEAAEVHAANDGALPTTQAQVYGGQLDTVLRKYQARAAANLNFQKFEPNEATPEDSQAYRDARVRETPFDNVNKIDDALDAEIAPIIAGMQKDLTAPRAGTPQKVVQKGAATVPMTRPTPEGLAKEEAAARGTTRQQNLDYVYGKVQEALQDQTLPAPVRATLEQVERAMREGFEGVIQGDVYAERQQSKVTPQLLKDIEQLLRTKDPQDVGVVTAGLRLVSGVNTEDSTQGELFAGQDTPQVRIIRRSPFALRQLINSAHVQHLKEMLVPIEKLVAAFNKQMAPINEAFNEESLALLDRATDGAYSKLQERVAAFDASLNDMRMQVSRVSYVNEEAKRNNYEAVEAYIEAMRASLDKALAGLEWRVNIEMGNKPQDGGSTETFHQLHQKLLELRYSITREEQAQLKQEAGANTAFQRGIEKRLQKAEQAQSRKLPIVTYSEKQHLADIRAERKNLRRSLQKREPGQMWSPESAQMRTRVRLEREQADAAKARREAVDRIVATLKVVKEDNAKALEAAKRNMNVAAPVSAAQKVDVTFDNRQGNENTPAVVTQIAKTRFKGPDNVQSYPGSLSDKLQQRLERSMQVVAEAAAAGKAAGEAAYDAMPEIPRIRMNAYNNQVQAVNRAINKLADAESALTMLTQGEVAPVDQAAANERSWGYRPANTKATPDSAPAKPIKQVPAKGSIRMKALLSGAQERINKAELDVLHALDKLEALSEGIDKQLKASKLDKALGLSKTATSTERVGQSQRVGQLPFGGQRPPASVSPMNQTQHSLGAVRRADQNKNADPLYQHMTRPGPRGETSPTTSSIAPYTKDMTKGPKPESTIEEKAQRLKITLAKKGESELEAFEPTGFDYTREDLEKESSAAEVDEHRRNVLKGLAGAAVTLGSGYTTLRVFDPADKTTVGRAENDAAAQFLQDIPPEVARLLPKVGAKVGNGNALIRQVLDAYLAVGPKELHGLVRQIQELLTSANFSVETLRGRYNAYGAVGIENGQAYLKLMPHTHDTGQTSNETLLHELMHVVILSRYAGLNIAGVDRNFAVLNRDLPAGHPAIKQFMTLWKEFSDPTLQNNLSLLLSKETNEERRLAATRSLKEALNDPDEFFVRVLTDPRLRGLLQKERYKGRSLIERFKNWVKRTLFGIEGENPSWLDAALLASNELLAAAKQDPADFRMLSEVEAKVEGRAAPKYSIAVRTPSDLRAISERHQPTKEGHFSDFTKKNWGMLFRTYMVDRFDAFQRIADEMLSEIKATQMMYFLRVTNMVNQFTAASMTNGPLQLKKFEREGQPTEYMFESVAGDNIVDLVDALEGEDHKVWADYIMLERALKHKLGLKGLFGDAAPSISPEEQARILEYGRNNLAFQRARDIYHEYNRGQVKLLLDTGVINEKEAKDWTDRDYIPFYRVDPLGRIELVADHPIKIGNIRDQKDIAHLIGSDKNVNDPFENIARNTRIMVGSAVRNMAARNTAYAFKELGLGELHRGDSKESFGRNVIHFKQDGVDWSFHVNTAENEKFAYIPGDILAKSLEGIVTQVPTFLKLMQVPAKFLRDAITLNPLYMVRQLTRDPMHAWLSTGMDTKALLDAYKRAGNLAVGRDETGKLLRDRGLVGGQLIQGTDEDMGRILHQLQAGQGVTDKLITYLHNMGVAADATTRAAMYDNFVKEKNFSPLKATMATMQSINFSSRGLSSSAQWANMAIPFFNAQIQGLDSVYRSLWGKMPFNERLQARQKLVQRAMMLAAATIAYYAMVEDEDWYQRTPENVRLMNTLIPPIPGITKEPIRIPRPFEFGFMFMAVPEAILIASKGDPEAKAVWAALRNQMYNQIPGGSSFALPAAMKPIVEVGANHSFFTGKPIVPPGLEDAPSEDQWTTNTTETAKALGNTETAKFLGLSPMHIEHVVKGYTAAIGYSTLQMLDIALTNTSVPKPEKPWSRAPIVGPAFQQLDGGAIITRAYEAANRYQSAQKRYNSAVQDGRIADAQEVLDKQPDDLAKAKSAGQFKQKMGEITKRERQVIFAPGDVLSKEEKTELLKQLRQQKDDMARAFENAWR